MTNETITNMLDRVLSGENSEALNDFEEIISSKISDALETRKIEIAQSLGASGHESE